MAAEPAQIRWLAELIDLDLPDEDLEYLSQALLDHAALVQPLAESVEGFSTGYSDDSPQW